MSSAGKETIKSAHIIEGIELPPGHELTNTLSLEALFEIERPGEYTVLATLPVVGDVDALLAATPITFRVKAKADGAKR
jgi:hypothetical protein